MAEVYNVPMTRSGKWWIVGLALLCLVGMLLTFPDYGITWDEDVQARYGEMALDYFLSGGQDNSANSYYNLKYYGALFESGCAAVYRLLGSDPYLTRHLCIAITGLLTLLAVVLFGRLHNSSCVPLFAALALLLTPRFYGHSFNNSKDIPFACFFTWAMLALAWMLGAKRILWRHVLLSGLAIGLTLSIRMGGLLLLAFAAAVLLAKGGMRKLPIIVVIAWAVMVAAWPWAHENVLLNPIEAFRMITDFEATKEVRFAGEFVMSQDVPRSYLPWFLLITTPIPLMLLGCTGLAVTAVRQFRDPRSRGASLGYLLQLWLLFPLVFFVVVRPTVYDGIRHFLFLLPAIALFAAMGAGWIVSWFRGAGGRRLAFVAMAVLLLWPVRDLIILHPYQSSYFNGLVGGVSGAWRDYDTDYWASSYKEAAEWINGRAVEARGRPVKVLLAGTEPVARCFGHYLHANVKFQTFNARDSNAPWPEGVDYYVALTRRHYHENFPGVPVVHTIGRDGAIFAVIKAAP
jgi:4-amino-4-deoxy-L-arabinose transferase-like glycosyltransferase